MQKIGITGQDGFVGKHLYNTLGLFPEEFERIEFKREYFDNDEQLDDFVNRCDAIVHLAAMNRHESEEVIYKTNVMLAQKLADSLSRTGSKVHVLFSSSSQEERDNLYGRSKKEGREILAAQTLRNGGNFTGLIIPNVFGPFGRPNYNSFIATFCYKLTHGEQPEIQTDGEVKLIYVGELVEEIIGRIRRNVTEKEFRVAHTSVHKVAEVFAKLNRFREEYFEKGEIPALQTVFDRQLFNTFRSYIDHASHFPVKLTKHTDPRGAFVEVIR
ncbi:MAG: NAD-dependent epimerase/dehydratase family protein, partial [Chryseobacterium sp.]